jgi:hypothetical protein
MKKTEIEQNPAIFHREKTLTDFIEALYRIFKVGIYYPNGHAVLDQAVSNCVQQLREISTALKCINIESQRNGLLVEKIKLPDTSVSVKELHLLLDKLGIRSIEVDRTIREKQLLHFVQKLLAWRMQLESTQSYINFNIDDLPQGIHVRQQEFLIDETLIVTEDSENDYAQNLEDICIALGQQGLNRQQVAQCRELLEKFSVPVGEPTDEKNSMPNATWQDVQNLLYKIVTGAYPMDGQSFQALASSDINVISSIFNRLESSLPDKKSRATIQFLLSHMVGRTTDQKESVQQSPHPKKQLRRLLDDEQKLSTAELNKFIYENSIPIKVLKQITSVDNSEKLSILLQLISPEQDQDLIENLELELIKIVTGRLTDKEKDVLIGGIIGFVDAGNISYFRHLLPVVLHELRDSESLNSLDFIIALWSKMPHAMHLLLWPSVVNELLTCGTNKNRETFFKVTKIASHIHIDRMHSLRLQLELMDVFKKRNVAECIFDPTYKFSYKLFAFLGKTSLGDIIVDKIFSELREKPQDQLFAAVGPLLDMEIPAHLEFVLAYLAHAHLEEPPLALKMAAGGIILEYLSNISEESKGLPWLEQTIGATAGLYVKGMKGMLNEIVNARKMGVLHAWPKPCRAAAATALKSLQKRSLVDLL